MATKALVSRLDKSVNFITRKGFGQLEARFVQRYKYRISAYVSSHNGCRMGCKMCHLTAMNQMAMAHTTPLEYKHQLDKVLRWYTANGDKEATMVHVNFMARGEPLMNKFVVNQWQEVYDNLNWSARSNGFANWKPLVSTIMPLGIKDRKLIDIWPNKQACPYYSLYSFRQDFRKKWLPNAMDPLLALEKLMEYTQAGGPEPTLHWAFIRGENDNPEDVYQMAQKLKSLGVKAKLNIVRYNPPPGSPDESDWETIVRSFDVLNKALGDNPNSKIVTRVGFDVHASCGTFAPDV